MTDTESSAWNEQINLHSIIFIWTIILIIIFSKILGVPSATRELSWLDADFFQKQWHDSDSFASLNVWTLLTFAAHKIFVLHPDNRTTCRPESHWASLGKDWRFVECSFPVHWCEAMQRELCWARQGFFTLAPHKRVRHVSFKLLRCSENNCKPI